MRVAVVGAGAMGSMFGAHLALDGHDVTLVDVDAAHVSAIAERGLTMRFASESRTVRLRATTDPVHELAEVDAVIVLCKGWANDVAARSIAHALGPTSTVVTIQNGLGNDTSLATVLGPECVVSGTTTAGAHRPEPGIVDVSPITSAGQSITQLGQAGDDATVLQSTRDLADALSSAGLPCEILPDATAIIWRKLALAATAGPLTAAMGVTVEAMMDSSAARDLLRGLFDEIAALALAADVEFDTDAVWEHAITTFQAVGAHTTSMADDFAEGRRSEIDSFCVAISKLGRAHRIPTPTHDALGQLLVAREQAGGLR